jgi:lia operon protein LiaF
MGRGILQRTLWGLVLIAVGILFLLDKTGLIFVDFGYIFSTYWPVFIILAGLSGLLSSLRYGWGAGIWNLLVCMVGVIFLLRNLNVTDLSIGEMFAYLWPAALIVLGISMIFRSPSRKWDYDKRCDNKHDWTNWAGHYSKKEDDKARDYINTYAPGPTQHKSGFIGDVHLGQDYWELKPMTISHFIGDTVIDLTKASIPYGETKLVISSFVGDVKMFVPSDLDVEVSVTSSSFIGDMNVFDRRESGFFRHMQTETPYYWESDRKIRLIVSTFIGDVLVKKVG